MESSSSSWLIFCFLSKKESILALFLLNLNSLERSLIKGGQSIRLRIKSFFWEKRFLDMKQNYNELRLSISQYNENFKESETKFGKIQKIYSTPHLICFVIRLRGKTSYLYIGRGSTYQGLLEGKNPPPKEYRIKDTFLEYLRKNTMNSKVNDILLDSIDRIIYIPYYKEKKINCFSFFWRGKDLIFSNLYFQDDEYFIFNSWMGKKEKLDGVLINNLNDAYTIIHKNFDMIGRKKLSKGDNDNGKGVIGGRFLELYFDPDNSKLFKKNKNKKLKFLERKKEKIEKDIQKLNEIQVFEEKLKELKIQLDEKREYILCGKKIKFEKDWSQYKKRDFLFLKIKSLKKGLEILRKRKEGCELEIERNSSEKTVNEIQVSQVKVIKPLWKNEEKKIKILKQEKNIGFDEYVLDDKYKIAIGLNSQGNDNLRKSFGKKNDFWFHLDGYKSCHCIVKIENVSDLTDNYFEMIGSMIRDKSNLLIEVIPLVFTQVKNLKGLKGKAGSVTLKKEKYRDVKYNGNWSEIISKN